MLTRNIQSRRLILRTLGKFCSSMSTTASTPLLRARDPIPYQDNLPSSTSSTTSSRLLGHKKVSVIGCGQVGMATAYAMLNQTVAGSIALVDPSEEKLLGEAKDLEQGSAFHQNVRIEASTDYAVTENSHLVILTAGVAQKDKNESRLQLVQRNVEVIQSVIPNILLHSPDTVICVVSNPCDIMTAVANKVAGSTIPAGRIFGSGTCLDSSRLQSLLGKGLDVDAQSVQGYVIGEHGDSSVPVWSSVRIGGVPILLENELPTQLHDDMHRHVVESAGDVISKKGYTNWAVGLTGAYIANAVLNDTQTVMPLSTCVRGYLHDIITEDVFLSIPCTVGAQGIRQIVDLPLSELEQEAFKLSADAVWEVQKDVWNMI